MTRTHKILLAVLVAFDAAVGVLAWGGNDPDRSERARCDCEPGKCPAVLEPSRKGVRP